MYLAKVYVNFGFQLFIPVLKGPRVCNTTKQAAPPSKRHHEEQGALQTGQGQSCGGVQIRVGLRKKFQNFEHPKELH